MKLTDELAKNYPLPDQYLIEIGRITTLWGTLEASLNIGIGKLAGFDSLSDPTSFILLAHSSFPQRLDILAALCVELSPHATHLQEYTGVITQLKAAQSKRNRYSHNSLYYDSSTGKCTINIGSARGKLKFESSNVTIAQIREVSEDIHLAILALHKLITQASYPPIWERGILKKS
ncbi:hypothetical protein FHR56_003719 [Xanthomonas sacchari]|uniref:hypothetical protein n=1 Tax=Xanthomonas sp. F10 TaxID=3035309 RepID=UPI0016122A38|nr:hypothetical protein [Xanthomonas sp. F10]MBB6368540.1 hypothetical protein [Xanthomonas sp. F10]